MRVPRPVKVGLWSVAQRYGVSVDDLKRWNNIEDHLALRAGQSLTVHMP